MTRRPTHGPSPAPADAPGFAQPEPGPDPTVFVVHHPTDADAYRQIDELNREHRLRPLPFPAPRGGAEPRLAYADLLGPSGPAAEQAIARSGRIVIHAVGDTGNTRGPTPQNLVADKMTDDFTDAAADRPMMLLHLGDVVYNFGEAAYYYDQFYDPYRAYPAPIVALAGNHDGMVAPGVATAPLAAFLENFCAEAFRTTPQAGGLLRTAQIQPGVFFTLELPFLRILVLYSNTLEDPGVISSEDGAWPEIGDTQLDFLRAALQRAKSEQYDGALVLAHHHPAYTAGSKHGWSPTLTAQVDAICDAVGLRPHAVLSAHAHNYQRFTRTRGATQTPYLVAGGGGHGLAKLGTRGQPTLRTPVVVQPASATGDEVRLENYDDQDYGYLRIVATASQLRIEYHPAGDGDAAKTPDDSVTVDLATRQFVHFTG